MGAIRSFDGRNCDWFTPARCPVRMVRLSVATPWPPCWLIKYTRAVSVPYVPYSVGTPWPAYIKVVAVKPGRGLPPGLLVSLFLSVKANISGDGHAKIASWRPRLFDCLRSFAKLEPRVGQ